MSLASIGRLCQCQFFNSFEWKQLAYEIGTRLHREGAILTAETRPFATEDVEEALGTLAAFAYGSNCMS